MGAHSPVSGGRTVILCDAMCQAVTSRGSEMCTCTTWLSSFRQAVYDVYGMIACHTCISLVIDAPQVFVVWPIMPVITINSVLTTFSVKCKLMFLFDEQIALPQ